MFAKLLKLEWKATSGLLGILSLATLGVSLLVTALLRFAMSGAKNVPDVLWAPVWMLIVGGFVAMVAYSLAVHILLLVRFYKNKFTDEGYLTFTLPVTTHQILLSSLLNYLIWSIISSVVLYAAVALPLLVGTTQKGVINNELFELIWNALKLIPNETMEYLTLMGLSTVVNALSSMILVHTAIVMGAVIAKKHKILAAFGCYYGINMALGIITSMLTVGISLANVFATSAADGYGAMDSVTIAQMLIYAVVAVAGYSVSYYLTKHKLNLP